MRILLVLLLVLTFIPAQAKTVGQTSSQYSTINLKRCTKVKTYEAGDASFLCPGKGLKRLLISEGDLRFFIGYGKRAKHQRSSSQTLSAFNTIFKNNRHVAKIEWRVRKVRGKWKPFASIIRYYNDVDGKKWQTLVVTKVSARQSCHIAHIKASRIGANRLARKIADRHGRSFNCKRSPKKYN